MIRSYTELIQLSTFEDRFNYLKLNGVVANETFGFDRYLNQQFYKSAEWKKVRQQVIIRDRGCDLGCQDREICGQIIIHHMNPISLEDIERNPEILLDPEYLICVSLDTHNAIHYGDSDYTNRNVVVERRPGDTTPWR